MAAASSPSETLVKTWHHVDGHGDARPNDHAVGQIGIENAAAFQSPGHSVDGDGNDPKVKDLHKDVEPNVQKGLFQFFRFETEAGQDKDKTDGEPRGGNVGIEVFGAERWVGFGEENGRRNENEKLVFPKERHEFLAERRRGSVSVVLLLCMMAAFLLLLVQRGRLLVKSILFHAGRRRHGLFLVGQSFWVEQFLGTHRLALLSFSSLGVSFGAVDLLFYVVSESGRDRFTCTLLFGRRATHSST